AAIWAPPVRQKENSVTTGKWQLQCAIAEARAGILCEDHSTPAQTHSCAHEARLRCLSPAPSPPARPCQCSDHGSRVYHTGLSKNRDQICGQERMVRRMS